MRRLSLPLGFAQKVDPIWNEPVITGNAGALARDEREARNSYIVKKVDTERAAHAVRARAPALPVLGCLFRPHHFLGKALPFLLFCFLLNVVALSAQVNRRAAMDHLNRGTQELTHVTNAAFCVAPDVIWTERSPTLPKPSK